MEKELPPFPTLGVKLSAFLKFKEATLQAEAVFLQFKEAELHAVGDTRLPSPTKPSESKHSSPSPRTKTISASKVNMTTTDVCDKFLKPITSEKKQSYCEYLQERNSPDVGEASVFISHAWKYTFVEVVDALEHHFSNEPDIFIWFDLFSNNQHKASSLPFGWWRDTF